MSPPAAVTNVSTPYVTIPYVTVPEFKAAGTGVDYNSLVPGEGNAAQDRALYGFLADATGWAVRLCEQMILAATVDTETQRVRLTGRGELFIHPNNWPVLELRALSYGATPQLMTVLTDLSGVVVEDHGFTLTMPGAQFLTTAQGPIQFGGPMLPGTQVWATWTYVNGYPNTLLAATAIAGAMTLTLADATGIYAGITKLTIYDGGKTEAGLLVSAVAGNVVTVPPLAFTHTFIDQLSNAIRVSALPDSVKRATNLLAAALIKTRGNLAVIMDSTSGQQRKVLAQDETGLEDVAIAAELLEPFSRVR